jgi:hypothetical protein
VAAKTVPQTISTTVTKIGQSLIVAKFVRSYVAYVINPKNAPNNTACIREFFSIDGEITNIISATINKR